VQDLRRDVLLVMDHDAAGIDHLEAEAVVLGKPMHASRVIPARRRRWRAAVRDAI